MKHYTPLSRQRAELRKKYDSQSTEKNWEEYVDKSEKEYLKENNETSK